MHKHALRTLLLLLVTLLAAGCNLGQGGTDDSTPTPDLFQPRLQILSPATGSEVTIDRSVVVSVNVLEPGDVTRVQFLAAGEVQRTITPEQPITELNRTYQFNYTPDTLGELLIEVTVRREGVTERAQITLQVVPLEVPTPSTPATPTINPNDPTCRIRTLTALNFRTGPGENFPIIFTFAEGVLVPIIGRLGDNSWYRVQSGVNTGWVSGNPAFVTLFGFCQQVPVVPAPPSPPTATPGGPTATPVPPTPLPTNPPPPTNTPPAPTLPNLDAPVISGPEVIVIPADADSTTESFGVTIRNRGGAVNAQFLNIIRILPTGTERDLGSVSGLEAGQSIVLTVPLTFDTPGNFTLEVVVDSGNAIAEDSETDNLARLPIRVVKEAGP